MRKYALILGVILLFIACIALAQESDEKQPTAHIKNLGYDFGSIFEQESYVHKYVVKNTGNADLIIESVKPG
jgi:hypothetical protein